MGELCLKRAPGLTASEAAPVYGAGASKQERRRRLESVCHVSCCSGPGGRRCIRRDGCHRPRRPERGSSDRCEGYNCEGYNSEGGGTRTHDLGIKRASDPLHLCDSLLLELGATRSVIAAAGRFYRMNLPRVSQTFDTNPIADDRIADDRKMSPISIASKSPRSVSALYWYHLLLTPLFCRPRVCYLLS
jgi:hypothetical protein